jgi:hypothetical protein
MRFRSVPVLILGALTVLPGTAPVRAAGGGPGSGGGDVGGPVMDPRRNQDVSGDVTVAQRSPTAAVQLEGRAVDAGGKPLGGIVVKVFANGVLVASTKTEGDGTFLLDAHPMREPKGSAVIWFQSPDPERYVDASVVLWASKAAEAGRLFPECTQLLKTVGGTGKIEVTMRSVDERKLAVIESRCLEGERPTSSP